MILHVISLNYMSDRCTDTSKHQ